MEVLKKKKLKSSVLEPALDVEVEDAEKDDVGDGTAEELESYRRADMEQYGYNRNTGTSTQVRV